MQLHALRQPDPPVQALIVEHGREAVIEEIEEMCYDDLADRAMRAAVQMDESRIARHAAEIVLNGTYPDEAQAEARRILGRKERP